MPFTSNDTHPPRRNARSFDLDDSAAKAAAWVWHLHTSKPGITTEGRFISSHSRRRRSGSYDRKASRFQQEASTTTVPSGNNTETPMWDCGSNLYDTFELVAFGNQLDRSLMEVVPIRTPQAHPQEHHMKSPLHKPIRTLSLPRSLSRQTSKNCAAISSPNQDKFKLSKSYNSGTSARCTSSGEKASKKWSSMEKLMNVIKKMVLLHKQVSFMGCKRSTNVVESSQRPLDPISKGKDNGCTRDSQLLVNEKVRATRYNRGSECMFDELSIQYTRARSNSDSISNYKLSIPSKDNGTNIGDKASMQKKVRGYNSAMKKKIRSNSDGLLEHRNIFSSRRRRDEVMFMDNRMKGSNLGGVNVKERIKGSNLEGIREGIKGSNSEGIREGIKGSDKGGVNVREMIKGANEHLDLHKHLHHHHHHHHHHHYLHHNLGSESARLSPETMSTYVQSKAG